MLPFSVELGTMKVKLAEVETFLNPRPSPMNPPLDLVI